VWISIEQSGMVSGTGHTCLPWVVVPDWSGAAEFTNNEGPHWGIDNYRLVNYLTDFAEN